MENTIDSLLMRQLSCQDLSLIRTGFLDIAMVTESRVSMGRTVLVGVVAQGRKACPQEEEAGLAMTVLV